MTSWSITIGGLTILIFFLSILAAILCAELYLLLSKGVLGGMWHFLMLSMAIFALAEIASFGEVVGLVRVYGLSQVFRAAFLVMLCLGFWQQRKAFMDALGIRHSSLLLEALLKKPAPHRHRLKAASQDDQTKDVESRDAHQVVGKD